MIHNKKRNSNTRQRYCFKRITTQYVLRRAGRAPPGVSSEYVQRSRKLTTSKDNLQNLIIHKFSCARKNDTDGAQYESRSRRRVAARVPPDRPPNLRNFHYLERCQSKNKNISIISTLLGKGRSIS